MLATHTSTVLTKTFTTGHLSGRATNKLEFDTCKNRHFQTNVLLRFYLSVVIQHTLIIMKGILNHLI
jgi:hypothetical protein